VANESHRQHLIRFEQLGRLTQGVNHVRRSPERWVVGGVVTAGIAAGFASLVVYDVSGYGRGMLLLWLIGVCTLAFLFRVRARPLPRIARLDLLLGAALMLLFAPLYLARVYQWPVQVSTDEGAVMNVAHEYATRVGADPFGVSDYWLRPSLLFMFWGRAGQLIGGIDLTHMRLLHAFFGLLGIVACYALFRQALPSRWAFFAASLVGVSHALLMISRLAMRENTALLAEAVALALLIGGLRHDNAFLTYLGGIAAGLGFYVYHPGRVAIVLWVLFLVTLAALYRDRYPLGRLGKAAAISGIAFVLMAGPILIAESKAPRSIGADANPRSQLMIFPEGRQLQREWMGSRTEWDAYVINVKNGLGTFNNRAIDRGFIYVNPGHGFIDPLSGVLLWLGALALAIRFIRGGRREDPIPLLFLVGFVAVWLTFALLVNKAPNYTRLLVTLPFVAFLVTEAVRVLGTGLRSLLARIAPARAGRATFAVSAAALAAIAFGNLAIAWDFVDRGRQHGDPVGTTGRFIAEHPGEPVFLVADDGSLYRYVNSASSTPWLIQWTARFKGTSQAREIVPPSAVSSVPASPPFVLLMNRNLLNDSEGAIRDKYPGARARNLMPDGSLVKVEVPAS
jgi:hypothetical protein